MRVAIGIHCNSVNVNDKSLELVKETYGLMSQKYFTHATPTLFNAGTPRPQMSSCYLIAMEEDTALLMVLFLCYEFLIRRLDMLTKEAISETGHLPSIWNHGIRIFTIS